MSDEKWPHADLVVQWYSAPQGSMEWRCRMPGFDEWTEWSSKYIGSWYALAEYQLRPIRKMEIMPEARVPATLRVAPKYGTDYFTIQPACENGVSRYTWLNCATDRTIFDLGLAFASEQDARDFLAAITARRAE